MRISDWSSDVCSSDLIVLGATGKHLDGAADFLVAADHRVQLAVPRRLGQVAGELLQCVIAVLGGRGVGAAALADLVDRGVQPLGLHACVGRSEERRVGKECVSTCRYRWAPYH